MSGLTKEELRSALINHGVSALPPLSAKKEELVALYEEHVAGLADAAGEFSSDEDVSLYNNSPSKRASAASRKTKASASSKISKASSKKNTVVTEENSLTVDGVDIDGLNDDDLFKMLKANGIEVGPIVESTRPFYKKKLALIIRGGETNGTNGAMGGSEEYSDTEPEAEPAEEEPALVVEPRVSRSSAKKASVSSKKSVNAAVPVVSETFGVRQRLMDEADSGPKVFTPTPRRSIHSYKVTETTKQTITKKDGVETSRDVQHSIVRSENGASTGGSRIKSIALIFLKLSLLAAFFFVVYVVMTTPPADNGLPAIDDIEDAVKSAQQAVPEAVTKAEEAVAQE